jgi:hypothetical protein
MSIESALFPTIALAEVAPSGTLDPDRNGNFLAKIKGFGESYELISYVSPYGTGTQGAFIAIPEPGVQILVCKPVGSSSWYYLGSTFAPEPEQSTKPGTAPKDSQVKPLGRADPYLYRAKGKPMRLSFKDKKGQGILIADEENKAMINRAVVLNTAGLKQVKLVDSPDIDSIILDSGNKSKITLTSDPTQKPTGTMPAQAVQIESNGPQKYLNAFSQTDLAVLEGGLELQVLNTANGVPYGNPPGAPYNPEGQRAGNVNIQSKWHDVNVFTQAEKGRIFIECLNTTGVDQVIEIQTNGDNGAIRIKTNGKVDIQAKDIGIQASNNINMKASGKVNIESGGDLSLKSGGTVYADGNPNIRLNEGGSESASPNIGNAESVYGNTGVTTYK